MESTNLVIPLIVIGLVLLALAVWLLMGINKKTTVIGDSAKKDVLDEGAAPAARNQALIDAPAAVKNNFGDTSARANTDAVAAAPAVADAEAGPSVASTTPSPESAEAVQPTLDPTAPPAGPKPETAPPTPKVIEEGVTKDDLRQIKGVGPKLVTMLEEQGITSFAQIAAWTESDVERVDSMLGRFQGRITRDQWVEQAKLLISGDKSAHAEKFGRSG